MHLSVHLCFFLQPLIFVSLCYDIVLHNNKKKKRRLHPPSDYDVNINCKGDNHPINYPINYPINRPIDYPTVVFYVMARLIHPMTLERPTHMFEIGNMPHICCDDTGNVTR